MNVFVKMAVASAVMAAAMRDNAIWNFQHGWRSDESAGEGHNKRSDHRVAMDKRAAKKARNRARHRAHT